LATEVTERNNTMKIAVCIAVTVVGLISSGCMVNPDGSVNHAATMDAWNTAANVANAAANVSRALDYHHKKTQVIYVAPVRRR